MEEYLFSIIVPVYNVEAYLKKCVDSLIRQEVFSGELEILLIDDGSKDTSGTICDELAKEDTRIKVFHKKNGGLSSARNFGLKQACGKYIVFVDSDDYIERNSCKRLAETIERNKQPDIIVFDGIEDYGEKQVSIRNAFIKEEKKQAGKTYLLEAYQNRNLNVEACIHVYRREFLKEHNLHFREGILHEDVEFTPRVLILAKSVVTIPDSLYHYMVRENSISTQRDKTKNIKDLFQTLKEQERLANQQDEQLCKWMKNGILDSYLNMVYTARMYQKKYRRFFQRKFLLGKAATRYNKIRVCLCFVSVRFYCLVNDVYKRKR